MKAYAIFEGGGAKGYAHIGALKAAEERGIEVAAVAGSSIGAVIACLIGAGYRADELYSLDDAGKAQGILSLDPLDRLNNRIGRVSKSYGERTLHTVGMANRVFNNVSQNEEPIRSA